LDYFAVLGLPWKVGLDPEELERRFYGLSRKFHPDFFQSATPAEQAKSLERSALVNRAYRTLRDPISRVDYLIRLELGEESVEGVPARAPVDLLGEMLEVQEALQEAKAAGLGVETRARLERERERLMARRALEEEQLLNTGCEWDAAVDGSGRVPRAREAIRVKLLNRMKETLAARAYLTAVIDDLSEALGEETRRDASHRRH
jgi:molecular chaperone HscB